MRKNSTLLFQHILCIFCLLGVLLSWGCHRSGTPQESRQAEINQIIQKTNAINAKIEMYRERALEHDRKLNAYRQEMKQLRADLGSETGAARKDRKSEIRRLKFFANHAKKARNAERIRIQVYTEDVKALAGDFDVLFKETTE
ncbi:MAG: hypothetical protein OXI63_01595 [Candidatus Poribacteria bacterium]|nr:hypothetical protein [Candidatus Poribacteria bacterium]